MIVKLDTKRRLRIPVALAPIRTGDAFVVRYDPEEDEIILRRVKQATNWLDVFKRCPVPMDDLPPRSREMPKKLKL